MKKSPDGDFEVHDRICLTFQELKRINEREEREKEERGEGGKERENSDS